VPYASSILPAKETPMKRLIFLLFMLLPLCGLGENATFSLTAPETLRPYASKDITVRAPADGLFTLQISDELFSYTIFEQEISAGETSFRWNGLHFNDEAVCRGAYTLTASAHSPARRRAAVLHSLRLHGICRARRLSGELPDHSRRPDARADLQRR